MNSFNDIFNFFRIFSVMVFVYYLVWGVVEVYLYKKGWGLVGFSLTKIFRWEFYVKPKLVSKRQRKFLLISIGSTLIGIPLFFYVYYLLFIKS